MKRTLALAVLLWLLKASLASAQIIGVGQQPPYYNDLAMYLLADDVCGAGAKGGAVADAAAIGSWTDRIGGQVFSNSTANQKPICKTNITNGFPVVRSVSSGTCCTLIATTAGAISTALTSKKITIYIVYKNNGASCGGCDALIGQYNGASEGTGNGAIIYGNSGSVGTAENQPAAALTTTNSGWSTFGVTWDNATNCSSTSSNGERWYVNGSAAAQLSQNAPALGSNSGTQFWQLFAANGNTNFTSNNDIYAVLVFKRTLNGAEMINVEKWARIRWNQALPWSTLPSMLVWSGDSTISGTGSASGTGYDPTKTLPYQVSVTGSTGAFGRIPGQYSVMSHAGANSDQINSCDVNETDLIGYAMNKPVTLIGIEWYNNNRDFGNEPAPYNKIVTYLSNRKGITVGPPPQIVWMSSTATGTTAREAQRCTFNTSINGTHANVDSYINLQTSTNSAQIGTTAAGCNNAAGDAHFDHAANFSDDVHPTATGYGLWGADVVTGINAVPKTLYIQGPNSGVANFASNTFLVQSNVKVANTSTVTVTASQGAVTIASGGGCTPSNNGTTAATCTSDGNMFQFTFTYTPASSGSPTLTLSNSYSGTNPSAFSYTAR